MKHNISEEFVQKVEEIVLLHGNRGMEEVRKNLPLGYILRAATLLKEKKGEVLIGTGFPVKGVFETDGPLGAIVLYKVLEDIGSKPTFVCAPPISDVLSRQYRTVEFPVCDAGKSQMIAEKMLYEMSPSLIISVERAGRSADGNYYNFKGVEITPHTAKLDFLFELANCPTLAFGDGGNEIGMGNVFESLLNLGIHASTTKCDELIISAVSNWGVYGVVTMLGCLLERDLYQLFDVKQILAWLVQNGALDGMTRKASISEDGFPLSVGLGVIDRLKALVS